eukprot:jgi/Chlat1/4505/Chrsp29S04440
MRDAKKRKRSEAAGAQKVGSKQAGDGLPLDAAATDADEMVNKALHPSALQRYLLTVEYIGTQFCGSQKQPGGRTVQQVLEDALQQFTKEPVTFAGSSRTDAGVHALGNTGHVDIRRTSHRKPNEALPPFEPGTIHKALNHFIAKSDAHDVRIVGVKAVPSEFHSRFWAQGRTYLYRIVSGSQMCPVFERERAWHVPTQLSLPAMQEACKVLVGHHDFSSFRGSGCQATSAMRTLDGLSVHAIPAWPHFHPDAHMREEGALEFVITARARSFLYHQVRIMAGALRAVGAGAMSVDDVRRVLEEKQEGAMTQPMAPAHGLYLAAVKYRSEVDQSTFNSETATP